MAKTATKSAKNVVANRFPRPITKRQYMVINKVTGEPIYNEKNTIWHNIDQAGQRHRKGQSVDVVEWNTATGDYTPIEQDWVKVYADRQAKRTGKKSPTPINKGIMIDPELIASTSSMSATLKESSTLMRRSSITVADLKELLSGLESIVEELEVAIDDLSADDVEDDESTEYEDDLAGSVQ